MKFSRYVCINIFLLTLNVRYSIRIRTRRLRKHDNLQLRNKNMKFPHYKRIETRYEHITIKRIIYNSVGVKLKLKNERYQNKNKKNQYAYSKN